MDFGLRIRQTGAIFLLLVLVGCHAPPLPDPNEPRTVRIEHRPEALMAPLKWTSDRLMEKAIKGDITQERARQLTADYAARIMADVDPSKVREEHAWQYGDLFRTARKWNEAVQLLKVAVEHAQRTKNGDREVNDSLRLAHALAEVGKVSEAIAAARSVFDAPDSGAAPILPAVLLEIVPSGRGKGKDVELARLLEDAIGHHRRTVVDAQTEAGKAFLKARWHHITNAWRLILDLYQTADRRDLWEAARIRGARMLAERLGQEGQIRS